MKTYRKDTDESIKIAFEWDAYVESSSWSVPAGLTSSDADYVEDISSIVILGGTLGTEYKVTNTVVLDNDETLQRSVKVLLVTK